MGIGNLVKNISRNQWFLFALLSATVFMSACQPASNANETTASPNTSVAVKAATEATTLRAPLSQQVYIWQRQWRPANQTALAQSQGAFQGLRISVGRYTMNDESVLERCATRIVEILSKSQ